MADSFDKAPSEGTVKKGRAIAPWRKSVVRDAPNDGDFREDGSRVLHVGPNEGASQLFIPLPSEPEPLHDQTSDPIIKGTGVCDPVFRWEHILAEVKKSEWFLYIGSICVLIAGVIFKAAVDPNARPFFWNDSTLWYDHKPEAFPRWVIILVGLFGGCAAMLFVEYTRAGPEHRKPGVIRGIRLAAAYCCSLMLVYTVTGVARRSVGALAPDFMILCMGKLPDDADDVTPMDSNTVCTARDDGDYYLREAKQSFPGLLTSLSVGLALYLGMYISWVALRTRSLLLFQMALMLVPLLMYCAILMGLQDIWTNTQHTVDARGGYILPCLIVPWIFIPVAVKVDRQYPLDDRGQDD
eukprot:comp20265_c0_seq1/m.25365 comp20265_c0_seq1/g.25365  ORF comp20265_c0_seq1/g.25365 comp20265_c0_seq1/m.25365 type:complete len:353 (-) comp20265_c0_seq1:53-1111(-)